jgi:hypothetical protein
MRWIGHVAGVDVMKNSRELLVGNLKVRDSFTGLGISKRKILK